MSFWQDKINEMRPAQPAQPQRPASWWQGAPARPPDVPARPAAPQVAPGYAPPDAQHLGATDNCPRCGSEEYAEIPIDVSYGGRGGIAETGLNLSQHKQCFDCRYPARNPSGEVVRGKSSGVRAAGKQTKTETRKVRQLGNPDEGSWHGEATFDSAQLIV